MTNEILGLKGKYKEVMAEKQKLEADVSDLQHLRQEDLQEMEELRKQQREVISESGSSEVNEILNSSISRQLKYFNGCNLPDCYEQSL